MDIVRIRISESPRTMFEEFDGQQVKINSREVKKSFANASRLRGVGRNEKWTLCNGKCKIWSKGMLK